MQKVKENRACGLNNILYIFAIYLLVTVALNSDLNSNRIVWWASVALFAASSVMMFIRNGFSIRHNKAYLLWIGGFFAICAASIIWAESSDYVLTTVKKLVVHYLILVLLAVSLKSYRDIEVLLAILLLASITNAIYLAAFNLDMIINVTDEITDRLGTGGNWNANSIGMMTSLGAVFLLYFFKQSKNILERIGFLAAIAFLAYISFITGSRKAFLIIVIGVLLYLPFAVDKKHRLKTILISLAIVALAFLLAYKIPYFYNIIGWRLDAIISSLTGTGELDTSAVARKKLITAALDAWRNSPILGCGIDCFRIFGKLATGRDYYAHNNYVELLADVGIVGFAAYYWGFVYCLVNLWKKRHNEISKLLCVVLVIILIMGYACVHYNDFLFEIILLAVFSFVSSKDASELPDRLA